MEFEPPIVTATDSPGRRDRIPNPRIRVGPGQFGRNEIGEVETEGLGMLAHDMGIACWELPDLHIRHE
jgi:hypothetical protein